ncbi:MAG: GNAT family N-acetyltransferase [Candidatus Eisenbacteria bacterium]
MTPDRDELDALDREYARFNAKKAIGDTRESSFREESIGPLVVTQDPSRTSSYYQRVLGVTPASLSYLDRALDLFQRPVPELRIDVDKSDSPALADELEARGFVACEELIWLRADVGVAPADDSSPLVRRLGPTEQDSILPFLTLGGPVDPAIWALRRNHHCTETFRAFVIDEEGKAVAMATTFVGEHGLLLGNALTLPTHRRRGYQRALLRARLADAAELGARWVVTDVEPDTTSFRNCGREGFTETRRQVVWERSEDASPTTVHTDDSERSRP